MDALSTEPRTRGERTRAALVEAGRARFARLGFDGALGADIAADAGVSEPSIVFHFGSKRGLFIAVMEAYFDATTAEIDRVVDLGLDPPDRLEAFSRWWIDHLATHRELLAEFEHQALPGRAGDDVTEAYRRLIGRFTRYWVRMIDQLKAIGFVRDDVDSHLVLQVFVGATKQVVGDVGPDRPDDGARVRQLLDLVLTGAGATSARDASTAPDPVDPIDAKLDRILDRLDELDDGRTPRR